MKLLKFLFFFIILNTITVQAQHVINLPNVHIIAYDTDADFAIYQRVSDNSYKYLELYFEQDSEGFIQTVFKDEDDKLYTLEYIRNEYSEVLFVNDILPISYDVWLQSDWSLQNEDTSEKEVNVLKFKESGFVSFEELEAIDTTEQSLPNANASLWEIMDAYWLRSTILDFGNGKQVLLLIEDSDVALIMIPLQNSIKTISDDIIITNTTAVPKDAYHVNYKDAMTDFEADYTYMIKKDASNKFRVYDYFKNDLLNVSYDTIIYNEYYIIGKKNDEYFIYTSLLKKLEISNVKKVHLNDDELEILSDQGANYYNHLGMISESKFIQTIVCGTVESVQYKLITDQSKKHNHSIKIIHGGIASEYDESKEFVFTNIKNKYSISFLDGKKNQYWDENMGKQTTYPKYLKIKNGEKYGIRSYIYSMHDSTFSADTIHGSNALKKQIIHRTPEMISSKEELPIKYDSIEINKNGLVLFYKKNKLGIFPQQKKPHYESLESVTASFYKIIKNGKAGWLDITTMEEFFF